MTDIQSQAYQQVPQNGSAGSAGSAAQAGSVSYTRPGDYVGFDTITTQIENRLVKRGFTLNVMLVGPSGLGKSTMINTLFSSHLEDSCGRNSIYEPVEKTPEIKVTSKDLVENNVVLHLNVIDTPGFADQINNAHCWDPLMKYIKDQHNQYLRRELNASREAFIKDTRVHCALYFIAPTYSGLTKLDVQVLKKLTDVVNVVPVIAKADTLTLEERANLKRVLQDQFKHFGLNMYPYNNSYDSHLSTEEIQFNKDIASMEPFAVIGSEESITLPTGETVRGRRTKWGQINVEDVTQCEFVYLRDFLTRTHLFDLIETTSLSHYETFRTKQLTALRENVGRSSAHQSQMMSQATQGTQATQLTSQQGSVPPSQRQSTVTRQSQVPSLGAQQSLQ